MQSVKEWLYGLSKINEPINFTNLLRVKNKLVIK
ncbi:MAG: Unknown protein, partial [uncultured Sulfurovum sp.]